MRDPSPRTDRSAIDVKCSQSVLEPFKLVFYFIEDMLKFLETSDGHGYLRYLECTILRIWTTPDAEIK